MAIPVLHTANKQRRVAHVLIGAFTGRQPVLGGIKVSLRDIWLTVVPATPHQMMLASLSQTLREEPVQVKRKPLKRILLDDSH